MRENRLKQFSGGECSLCFKFLVIVQVMAGKCSVQMERGNKQHPQELSGSHCSCNNSQPTPKVVLPHFPLNNGMHCSGSEPARQ